MIRRRNAMLLALGLLAPLVLVDAPAGALDQDLVVSVTAGPPGTDIVLSSATCVDPVDENAYLEASLYLGTEPNQQIIAYASGGQGTVTLTVPDWVDADQPAVIEATCQTFADTGDDDFIEYDPVAFDIEPGAGAPVQVRTFARTEFLAGQGTTITGSCGPDLADGFVAAIAFEGTDQSGKDLGVLAGQAWTEAGADGSFEVDLVLSDAYVSLGIETEDGEPVGLVIEEEPMGLQPGAYTAFVYCSAENSDSSIQFLEPQPLTLTGSAPTDGMELVSQLGSRNVTLSGACDQGDVTGTFDAISTGSLLGGFSGPGLDRRAPASPLLSDRTGADGPLAGRIRTTGGSNRALTSGQATVFAAATGSDGGWEVHDAADFDEGLVIAIASCGDPTADGYLYDPQGVEIEVEEPTTTVPPTVPPTTPAPPANAVPGTPNYAG